MSNTKCFALPIVRQSLNKNKVCLYFRHGILFVGKNLDIRWGKVFKILDFVQRIGGGSLLYFLSQLSNFSWINKTGRKTAFERSLYFSLD